MFAIDKNKFGAFVAERRKEKGFTQKELARQLFLSDKAVSKWETGAPTGYAFADPAGRAIGRFRHRATPMRKNAAADPHANKTSRGYRENSHYLCR